MIPADSVTHKVNTLCKNVLKLIPLQFRCKKLICRLTERIWNNKPGERRESWWASKGKDGESIKARRGSNAGKKTTAKMDKLAKNKMAVAAHRPPSGEASHLLEEERRLSWRCSALKITKRVPRGTKLRNRRRRRDGRRVFAETVSSSATGATGGSVCPLFHPFSPFLSLSLPRFLFAVSPSVIPSRFHPPSSLASLALARGCDLKCKLKYSSWYLRANRFDINGASAPRWEREGEDFCRRKS